MNKKHTLTYLPHLVRLKWENSRYVWGNMHRNVIIYPLLQQHIGTVTFSASPLCIQAHSFRSRHEMSGWIRSTACSPRGSKKKSNKFSPHNDSSTAPQGMYKLREVLTLLSLIMLLDLSVCTPSHHCKHVFIRDSRLVACFSCTRSFPPSHKANMVGFELQQFDRFW
jgi:hypothetical protein